MQSHPSSPMQSSQSPMQSSQSSMQSSQSSMQSSQSSTMPLVSSNDDSKIPQLEPRYTSVYTPTNAYTWQSTPMPNTDNYYIDSINRNYSPILFPQDDKELGGYRYDEIKTGQLTKDGEPFISQNSRNKYNSINRIIFIFVVIIIIFLIIKYNLI